MTATGDDDPFPLPEPEPLDEAAAEDIMQAYLATLRPLCDWDPTGLAGKPIGMLHCPHCGCMVLAGVEHPLCDPDMCALGDPV